MTETFITPDAYAAACPEHLSATFERMRSLIRAAVPDAVEHMGYGVISYAVGSGRMHVGYAKRHLALYPGREGVLQFEERLSELGFDTAVGTIRCTPEHPLSDELVQDIARWALLVQSEVMPRRGAPREKLELTDRMCGALEDAGLMDAYLARPPYQRNDYISWVESPKRESTRQAHLAQMLDELRAGNRYKGMPWPDTTRPKGKK